MLADNAYFPPFSKEEYKRRHRVLRDGMKQQGLDCLLIYGAHRYSGTDPGQYFAGYLSNYSPIGQSYVVFPLKDDPTLVIPIPLHIPNATEIGAIEDVRSAKLDVEIVAAKRLQELGLEKGNIGLVGPLSPSWFKITVPVEHHNHFSKTLPQANFQNVSEWYESVMMLRSEEEIKVLEKANALTDLAYDAMMLATKPGVKHSDIRRAVETVIIALGGNFSFLHVGSTPMTNPQMAYPDYWPTYRTVQTGDVMMTELPAGYGYYGGKIMGTFFVGEPTKEYRDMFEVAAKVLAKALSELKPGMKGRDVKKWLKPVTDAGYTMVAPLIMGLSTYNSPPSVGLPDTSPTAYMETQKELDFEFKPGHCIYVTGRASTLDLKKGVWLGSCCTFTQDGLRKFSRHDMTKIKIV